MVNIPMESPLTLLASELESGSKPVVDVASESLNSANGNSSHNTYLFLDANDVMEHARWMDEVPRVERGPLFGVPISLKDCFDLAGTVTTCGSRFYAERSALAVQDSGVAARLKAARALIPGKTHMHPLAYGITGQNPDYKDCLQPRDGTLLTGGSSSGAAASVQEGSALAAIGTDTGGSVRVPAALCGLVGYRASHGLGRAWPELWDGGVHLAETFDTIGILLRDARDAGPIARAVFGVAEGVAWNGPRIGYVGAEFLHDCDADVMDGYEAWKRVLVEAGATLEEFDTSEWSESQAIFAPIQASEAAALHRGNYERFEGGIRQRLEWGASLAADEVDVLRARMASFRRGMAELLARYDVLVMPCAPVSRLVAADNEVSVRQRILRYTTPFSLAGLPVVAMPGEMIGGPFGTGVQMAAAQGEDGALLAYVAVLTDGLVARQC